MDKAEIDWSSLLIYGDINWLYNVIYQPSLFAHINSIDTLHSNRKFWKTTLWNSSVLDKVYGYDSDGVYTE